MELREIEMYNFIPVNGYYATDSWYTNIANVIQKILINRYGNREIIEDFGYGASLEDDIVPYVKDCINCLFIEKKDSYKKIFDVMNAYYNPIWNVESKETLTYERTNTGNVRNQGESSGENSTTGSNTGTVGVQGSNGGTVSVQGSNTGTVGVQGTVNNTSTQSLTPYNSSTFLDTSKIVDGNSDSSTRTDNLQNTETTTNNLTNSQTTTNNLQSSNSGEESKTFDETRTDNLSENYSEEKTRGGNIGTTKSSELVESEVELRTNYSFMNLVCKDIISYICYGC